MLKLTQQPPLAPVLSFQTAKQEILWSSSCSSFTPLPSAGVMHPWGLKSDAIWQTDIKHISEFACLEYVLVMIGTCFKNMIIASVHRDETTLDATNNLLFPFFFPEHLLHWKLIIALLILLNALKCFAIYGILTIYWYPLWYQSLVSNSVFVTVLLLWKRHHDHVRLRRKHLTQGLLTVSEG